MTRGLLVITVGKQIRYVVSMVVSEESHNVMLLMLENQIF